MNKVQKTQIIIVGGGMVGLVLALALAEQDFQVVVIENKIPLLEWEKHKPTARVSAVNLVTQQILQNLQLWQQLNNTAVGSLQRLVVWDGIGSGKLEFDAKDIGVQALGSILENRDLIKVSWQRLLNHPRVKIINAEPVLLQRIENAVCIELSDGTLLQGELCVGADGANSWVRQSMQAGLRQRSYAQQAIIAVVSTELAHQHTGRQVFLPSGPLALLPLANLQQCAIVWSNTSARADALMAMDDNNFECELNNAFGFSLGDIKCHGGRQIFPLAMRHVTHYVESPLALVGDAAHTLHPLAGQGVNLGLLDAACLVDCLVVARQKKQKINSVRPLRRYERWRKGDNSEMILAMRFLNDLFSSEATLTVQARSVGFNALNHFPWLKKCFIQAATTGKVALPLLARGY